MTPWLSHSSHHRAIFLWISSTLHMTVYPWHMLKPSQPSIRLFLIFQKFILKLYIMKQIMHLRILKCTSLHMKSLGCASLSGSGQRIGYPEWRNMFLTFAVKSMMPLWFMFSRNYMSDTSGRSCILVFQSF